MHFTKLHTVSPQKLRNTSFFSLARAVRSRRHIKTRGFTIVELLIVIVVIGILVAIVIVAYNGIQQRAHAATVQADLEGSAKQMANDNTLTSSYALTAAAVDSGKGLPTSAGTTYVYHSTGTTYCITGTNGTSTYMIADTAPTPTAGGCPGDGVGGVAAITNYAQDPDATSLANFGQSGGSPASSTASIATDQVYHGTTSFKRAITSAGQTGAAARIPSQSLKVLAGQSMAWSFWIYSSRAGTITPWVDASKVSDGSYAGCGSSSVGIPANAWTKVIASCSASVDMYPTQAGGYNLSVQTGDAVWFDAYMIQSGASLANYADGNSPSWIWNGSANSATSTGPPQ